MQDIGQQRPQALSLRLDLLADRDPRDLSGRGRQFQTGNQRLRLLLP